MTGRSSRRPSRYRRRGARRRRRVLRSGMVAQGPEVAAFEQEFSEHCRRAALRRGQLRHVGAALGLLALRHRPRRRGHRAVVHFAATANAVALTGATPVFVDIEPDNFCLDPAASRRRSPRAPWRSCRCTSTATRPTWPARRRSPTRHGLRVFEDAAQAHGAALGRHAGRRVRRFAMFSFYPTKNMTSGEGGMVPAPTPRSRGGCGCCATRAWSGSTRTRSSGFNNRMTDIHAAIGRVQLTKVPRWTEQRQANAAFLDAEPARASCTPPVADGAVHVYHQYTVRVPDGPRRLGRRAARRARRRQRRLLPDPRTTGCPPFATRARPARDRAGRGRVLSLPVHPSLAPADLERIVDAVNTVARRAPDDGDLRAGLIGLGRWAVTTPGCCARRRRRLVAASPTRPATCTGWPGHARSSTPSTA